MFRFYVLLLITLVAGQASSQSIELDHGSMHIVSGTTVRFEGATQFVINTDAEVINDGVIDLGTSATISEAVGSAIRGLGVERAEIVANTPVANLAPGGLGLVLSTEETLGGAVLTRGHVARSFSEGDEGIERWYRLDAPGMTSGQIDATLIYDVDELNGLSGSSLSLFRSVNDDGIWNPIISTNNATSRTVSGFWIAPWSYLTAFDANAPTASPSLVASKDILVWPTVTNGPLFIRSNNGTKLDDVRLCDALGRTIATTYDVRTPTLTTLDLSTYPAGSYFLIVNGHITVKLRKE